MGAVAELQKGLGSLRGHREIIEQSSCAWLLTKGGEGQSWGGLNLRGPCHQTQPFLPVPLMSPLDSESKNAGMIGFGSPANPSSLPWTFIKDALGTGPMLGAGEL